MTMAAGAHSTFDEASKGNREDLSDIMNDVSPTETPVLTMIGRTKATGTNHEWLTDTLATAAANAVLEGDDATGADPSARVRLGNYTQILSKNSVVTGTQEKVLKAGGVKSEMAYQMARRMKELKRDMEFTIVGQTIAKAVGSETVVRKMGSLDAYLKTNNQVVSPSTTPAGTGADVSDYAGTNRAMDETILNTGLSAMFTNSSGNESVSLICTAATKKVISTFTASSTRHVTTDDKKLVASIDVYVGDFHTVKIVADRFCKTGNAFIIDPEYLKLAELRPVQSFDLAKNGDSERKQLVWEATLEVCNEKAHCLIGDLTT
jgi:hypothetical protein